MTGDDNLSAIEVSWLDSGREPQCPPDPRYPNGMEIPPPPNTKKVCTVPLPYPAPRCGLWLLHCQRCNLKAVITAAGRPDDTRLVNLPCRVKENRRGKRQTHH